MSGMTILSIFYVYDVEKVSVFFVMGHFPTEFPEFSASHGSFMLVYWMFVS